MRLTEDLESDEPFKIAKRSLLVSLYIARVPEEPLHSVEMLFQLPSEVGSDIPTGACACLEERNPRDGEVISRRVRNRSIPMVIFS